MKFLLGNSQNNRLVAPLSDPQPYGFRGFGGNDTLIGGSYNDLFIGGPGRDVLTGGGGADEFRFTSLGQSKGAKRDVITDFEKGVDKINISPIADSNPMNDIQSMSQSIVNGREKTVYVFDLNHDNKADFSLEFRDLISLSKSDFIL